MIDMASVYAERFKQNPQALQAAVMGQSPDPKLDPYTALNALRLIKESNMIAMAGQAQQPTSSPSIVAENMAPPPMMQGLGAMVPGAMGQMPQGMPPQGPRPAPQAPVMQASGGLAALHTPDEDYAEGGIVAFAGDEDENEADSGQLVGGMPTFTSRGDPETYGTLASQYPGAIEDIRNIKYESVSPKQYEEIVTSDISKMREAMGGGDLYKQLLADMQSRDEERAGVLESGKGVALLKAAAAMAQGNNWVRAFGNAGAEFGTEYNRALQADKAEKRSIALAKFNIADAQRKENMGLLREARQSADRAVTANTAAQKAKLDKAKAVADALSKGMSATKPLRSAFGGAGGPKPPKLAERLYDDNIANLLQTEKPKDGETDAQFNARIRAKAGELTAQQIKDVGPVKAAGATAALTAKQNAAVMKNLAAWEDSTEAYKAKKDGSYADKKATKEADLRRQAMEGVFDTDEGEGGAAPTSKPTTTTKPGTVLNYDANGKRIK